MKVTQLPPCPSETVDWCGLCFSENALQYLRLRGIWEEADLERQAKDAGKNLIDFIRSLNDDRMRGEPLLMVIRDREVGRILIKTSTDFNSE
jgi:hypothetical protein